jgi:hypothetical protein
MSAMMGTSRRRTGSPLALLSDAVGTPAAAWGKARRFGGVLRAYARGGDLERKLARLHAVGVIDTVPTRVQVITGGIDMLRFFINPAAAEYYQQQDIDYWFHLLLRFCDEPASMTDPIGFFSTADAIIGHLMQVVHTNPTYDLQLLTMYEHGLEELERQVEAMIAGTHPRARAIRAIVEEEEYHPRLLEFVRAYRRDPRAPAPLRSNIVTSPVFSEMERTFGTLTAAMRYFAKMPSHPLSAARHLATVKVFPRHLAG